MAGGGNRRADQQAQHQEQEPAGEIGTQAQVLEERGLQRRDRLHALEPVLGAADQAGQSGDGTIEGVGLGRGRRAVEPIDRPQHVGGPEQEEQRAGHEHGALERAQAGQGARVAIVQH